MVKDGWKTSGILMLIGATIALIPGYYIVFFGRSNLISFGIWLMIISGVGIISGILVLSNKIAGAIIAIVSGAAGLIVSMILFWNPSILYYDFLVTPMFIIGHIMLLSSGIIGTAIGSK